MRDPPAYEKRWNKALNTVGRYRDALVTIASRPCSRLGERQGWNCREAGLETLAWCSECLARKALEQQEE